MTVDEAAPGTPVKAGASDEDWIVPGSRYDGAAVRQAGGEQVVSGPHVTGNPRSAVVPGPFSVSWTGGMPEGARDGARTWLAVAGPKGGPETGFRVDVPAGRGVRTLTMYVGALYGPADLELRLGDGTSKRIDLPDGRNGWGYVVTVEYRSDRAQDTLGSTLLASDGAAVAIAAAVLD